MKDISQYEHLLFIDLETYSSVDLSKCGAAAYAASPDFSITLTGWAVDGEGPVTVSDGLPAEVIRMVGSSTYAKVAHNASFEMTCLRSLACWIDPGDWFDTMHMAARLGLPASLADLSRVLGLYASGEGKKDGKKLIQMFACPGSQARTPEEAPDEWKKYKEYNRYDVIAERGIFHRLSQYTTPDGERQIEVLDSLINANGCRVDTQLAEGALKIADEVQRNAAARLKELTGLANPNSRAQLIKWLDARGIHTDSLTKKDYPTLMSIAEAREDAAALEVLQLRSDTAKAAVKKYDAIKRCATYGRICGMTQYYGAGTGRWAGRLVQLQNLKKNSLPDLAEARELVRAADLDGLQKKYPDTPPLEVLGQLIRTALIPSTGRKFIVADFSAIEARVIAWLAGEKWRNDVFARDGDIYKSSYSQAFGVPVADVTKEMRQKGKIMELALGYQGSVGALKAFGADKLGLDDIALKALVDAWRKASPSIVRMWYEFEDLAREAVISAYRGVHRTTGGSEVVFSSRKSVTGQGYDLVITLPSGRDLCYVRARVDTETGRLCFDAYKNGRWQSVETYGGKLVENVTQAVARDCLGVSMCRLAGRDPLKSCRIIAHVHDEVIIDAPKSVPVSVVEDIMGEEVYPGLHLTAKGYQGSFYYKD